MGPLAGCTLGNDVLLGCLRALGLYRHPDSGQLIRVNYAALNVEEFGSVYESLLEYKPEFGGEGRELRFEFRPLAPGTRVYTDEHAGYDRLPNHESVKHSARQYVERHGPHERYRELLGIA